LLAPAEAGSFSHEAGSFGHDAGSFGYKAAQNQIPTNYQQYSKRIPAMAKIKIRPLDDRVVVEPLKAEEKTAGGIVLPDSAQEKPQRGTVVAVGPGRLLDSGSRGELSVAVGDEVIYGKYGGTDIEINGEEVKILRESDILAKVVS
jgi:chaperonin GroES